MRDWAVHSSVLSVSTDGLCVVLMAVAEVLDKLLDDTKSPPSAARRSELTTLRNKAGAMNADELKEQFAAFNIRSPSSNNALTEPFAFNLMFQTSIGPSGSAVGYLRPETAQGIFVNYRRLLDFNNGKVKYTCTHTQPHTQSCTHCLTCKEAHTRSQHVTQLVSALEEEEARGSGEPNSGPTTTTRTATANTTSTTSTTSAVSCCTSPSRRSEQSEASSLH